MKGPCHAGEVYFHVDVPNAPSCMYPPGRISTTASSVHPGGVNVLLCDGSVRMISPGVSLYTWRAIGSRNGDEVLPNDW